MIPIDKIFGRLGNNLFQGAYLYVQMLDRHIPDIYVQDPKYFEHHEKEIKALFGQGSYLKRDQVAIHVRRGDYVDNPFYIDLMKTDYYEKAMAEFPDASFLVISDDINWCVHNFPVKDYKKVAFYVEMKDEIDDFNMMASCTGHIIANSSFSWWAAYLSPNGGKVVAPSIKNWYSDGIERTKCPDNWIRL